MIRWPDEYHPSRAILDVRNELDIPVPPEAVWAWLVRAELWPSWYLNAHNVRIEHGAGPDLAPGTVFRWTTFGLPIRSRVEEFVPGERIAWDAHGLGLRAYHAWVIERSGGAFRSVFHPWAMKGGTRRSLDISDECLVFSHAPPVSLV
jgi:uncharacterized protein YndB with AHSA1/START domain